jgi:hypothetical protein
LNEEKNENEMVVINRLLEKFERLVDLLRPHTN